MANNGHNDQSGETVYRVQHYELRNLTETGCCRTCGAVVVTVEDVPPDTTHEDGATIPRAASLRCPREPID